MPPGETQAPGHQVSTTSGCAGWECHPAHPTPAKGPVTMAKRIRIITLAAILAILPVLSTVATKMGPLDPAPPAAEYTPFLYEAFAFRVGKKVDVGTCPSGYVVTGGGYETVGQSKVKVIANHPTNNGNG